MSFTAVEKNLLKDLAIIEFFIYILLKSVVFNKIMIIYSLLQLKNLKSVINIIKI